MYFKIVVLASLFVAAHAKPEVPGNYQGTALPGTAGAVGPVVSSAVLPAGVVGGTGGVGSFNVPVFLSSVPRYDFNYAVRDVYGNDYGHEEARDGQITRGFYYVRLPDSRLQRVSYVVNGNSGFVAQVAHDGVAQFPVFQSSRGFSPLSSYN